MKPWLQNEYGKCIAFRHMFIWKPSYENSLSQFASFLVWTKVIQMTYKWHFIDQLLLSYLSFGCLKST